MSPAKSQALVRLLHNPNSRSRHRESPRLAFDFAPIGWAFCNGQLLSIAQNQALFALLGTQYGGDGHTTFALPNLQGAVPLGAGPG
jgi:microcystin-dependent protein